MPPVPSPENRIAPIHWDEREWRLVAAKLDEQHPEMKFSEEATAKNGFFGLKIRWVNEAIEAALPPSRHRRFVALTGVRHPLAKAYAQNRMFGPPVSQENSHPDTAQESTHLGNDQQQHSRAAMIMWSPREWQRVILELHRLYPEVFNNRLQTVSLNQLQTAIEVLPEDRRRYFKDRTKAIEPMLKIMRDMTPPSTWVHEEPAKQEEAPVEQPAAELPQPVTPQPEAAQPEAQPEPEPPSLELPPPRRNEGALAAAMREAAEKTQKKTRVYWRGPDYLAVAWEIHRQNPFYGWPYKEHLAGLSTQEVNAAMHKALPKERWRVINTPAVVRDELIEAFKVVRAELEAEKAQQEEIQRKIDEEAQRKAEALIEEVIAPVAAPTPSPAAIAPPAPATQAAGPLMEQIAQAAAPLFRVFAEQFGAVLKPMIEEAVLTYLTAPQLPAQPQAEVPKEPQPDPEEVQRKEEEREIRSEGYEEQPHPPKIGLIGPGARQLQDLRESYPHIDFVFIEKGQHIPVEKCEKIIVIEDYLTEPIKKVMRLHKDKFCQLSGGVSSIKRQINLWLHAGEVKMLHQSGLV